jgi:hypothetical protein
VGIRELFGARAKQYNDQCWYIKNPGLLEMLRDSIFSNFIHCSIMALQQTYYSSASQEQILYLLILKN